MMSEKEVRDLLNKLCAKLGFCLPPDDVARIAEDPPSDVLAFTDVVFVAEGLDPSKMDRRLYRQVRDVISDALGSAEYNGV